MIVPPEERFWAKVDCRADGCWCWSGYLTNGYGRFSVDGQLWRVHRWAYEHFVGPIPDGLHLDHLCRNRGCVNPAHMEPVTIRENTLRGLAPRKRRTGIRGVSYKPELSARNPWRAQIMVLYKQIHLGLFATRAEAIEARKAAEYEHYGRPCIDPDLAPTPRR